MLLSIPDILTRDQVLAMRNLLDAAEWIDGKVTAGAQSGMVKRNEQLPEGSPLARELGDRIIDALGANATFVSAALPLKTYPPLFNRYAKGQGFGTHVDNAIRPVKGTAVRLRIDLSATLFLSEPEEYDGGELIIEDSHGAEAVKLPAGHMVLYPSTSLHQVTPVTRGVRVASFFWVQSMVRDDGERSLLFDLDQLIQSYAFKQGIGDDHTLKLGNIYHNLVRRWADC